MTEKKTDPLWLIVFAGCVGACIAISPLWVGRPLYTSALGAGLAGIMFTRLYYRLKDKP